MLRYSFFSFAPLTICTCPLDVSTNQEATSLPAIEYVTSNQWHELIVPGEKGRLTVQVRSLTSCHQSSPSSSRIRACCVLKTSSRAAACGDFSTLLSWRPWAPRANATTATTRTARHPRHVMAHLLKSVGLKLHVALTRNDCQGVIICTLSALWSAAEYAALQKRQTPCCVGRSSSSQ